MIKFTQKGDFSKLESYLKKQAKHNKINILEQYGKMGVAALREATPVDTGKTASSWSYSIKQTSKSASITWSNSNVQNGVPIAIILQYGHATGNGGWVEGRDYINPAIKPIFDKMTEELWKEITEV